MFLWGLGVFLWCLSVLGGLGIFGCVFWVFRSVVWGFECALGVFRVCMVVFG